MVLVCVDYQLLTGWCSFRGYNWFWIFIVGPHIGAILGVCLFQVLLKVRQNEELDIQKGDVARQPQHQDQQHVDVELCNIKTVDGELHSPEMTAVDIPRIRW